MEKQNYIIVSNKNKKLFKKTLGNVQEDTTHIHLSRHPPIAALKAILTKAPKLKVIQIPPSRRDKFSSSHLSLLKERGVKLILGTPGSSRKGKPVGHLYVEQR